MSQAYHIPNGPANLESLFPDIDFTKVKEYYISGSGFTGPINKLDGECCSDKFRIHFQNYLGGIDALNFCLIKQEHEVKSDLYTRPTDYPLRRERHGQNKIQLHANDILWLSNNDYEEEDKKWLTELLDTPKAWIETEIGYIPVVVQDDTFETVHEEDRFLYPFNIKVKLSHEKIIIRN